MMKSIHIYACALVLSGCCLVANPLSGVGANPFSGNAAAMKQQACKTYKDYDQALQNQKKLVKTYTKNLKVLSEKERQFKNMKGFGSDTEIAKLKAQVVAERIALKLNLMRNGFSDDDAEYFIVEKIESKNISIR